MTTSLLIENGMVLDGKGNAPCAAAVLIAEGRIAALGAEAEQRAVHSPNGVARLDAKGMTVMPGLIDTHCHLAFDDAGSNSELFFQRRNALSALIAAYNAKKLLRAGVTGILDPDSTFENMIDLRDAIDAGIVQGPRMACGAYALITTVGGTAGRLIGDEGITGYYKVVRNKDEIVTEVRRQIKNGADWIKVHVTGIIPRLAHLGELCVWSDEELKVLVETAHALGTPCMGHCRGADATYRAAKAGFDLIFHATAMDARAAEEVIRRKVPISPDLTFQANMVDFGAKIGTDPSLTKLFEREITDSVETMKQIYAAGVPLMCGSESGFTMVPYGDWHYREMEVFVRYLGLTPLQAIQCGTQTGAIGLKLQGKTGEITQGCLADVIVVDGDPSKDVRVLGRPGVVKHAFVGGRAMDLSPPAPRRDPSGWRVASMGKRLSQEVAFGADHVGPPVEVEELH